MASPARAVIPAADLGRSGALEAAATGFEGFVPDGFIRISPDGRIVLVVPSAEMGQGIATTEAMMLAEELEVLRFSPQLAERFDSRKRAVNRNWHVDATLSFPGSN